IACVQKDGQVSRPGARNGGTTGGAGGDTLNLDDPLAEHAWHLNNHGQNSFAAASAKSGEDINLKPVHEQLQILGRGVRIAIADSGIDINHPDLAGNALATGHRNYSFQNPIYWNTTSPLPASDDFHGTAVTG